MIGPNRVRTYLDRLGIDAVPDPSIDALRRLHAAHLRHIPFENLSIHLGQEIVLDSEALVAKIVDRQRGGFCYELNGAFATLLRALGFEVTMLAARVFEGDRLGPPFDHMCLRVDLDEPWFADVGFGDNFWLPLKLLDRGGQLDDAGTFRIAPVDDQEQDLLRDETPQYRFDLTPHELADYGATCLYHQTSPESHFTRNTVCSLPRPRGRVTITGNKLIVTDGADREERTLSDAELRDAYRQYFGIHLERLPLARAVPASGAGGSSG